MSLRAGGLTGLMNQPSAQVIDGSLKFDKDKQQYLQRTFGSGNRKTYTWSGWVKKTKFGNWYGSLLTRTDELRIDNTEKLSFNNSGVSNLQSTGVLRDPGSFYHVVFAVNTTRESGQRVKGYINGVEFLSGDASLGASANTDLNDAAIHYIGNGTASRYADYHLSQVYFIDGLALGPGYFGFTDPLTGTWRPKKLRQGDPTVNDGTVWSDSLTGARTDTNQKDKAFDGSLTTKAGTSGTGASAQLTFTSPKPIHFSSSVRVYVYWGSPNDVTMRLDGGESITVPGNTWTTLVEGTGSFKTLTVNGTSNSAELSAIEVDGVIMQDSTTTTVDFGTNGFYLPLDGSAPIGQDKSGQGNDWTPVNFGGSVALDSPAVSGARPILNTTQGGTQAGVGVFGSKQNVGYAVTVYDDGGGNKYYIDGVKQATLTGLIRGATYTFDTSDSTVGSTHPFRFAASDGGSQYSNGVAAITGTATTITIPYNAPNELYYYCTSHSGMGSSITGITTNEKLADQYASNCVLALPLVGSAADVSASIACTMTNKAVTSNGDAAAAKEKSNFYVGSFEFDGTNDTLTIPTNTDFNFGSEDYTIEMWVYPTRISATQENLITRGTSGYSGFIMSVTNFLDSTSGSAWDASITYDNALIANKWQHIAVCRNGDTWTVYINGVANGSDTASGSVSASGTLTIGERTGQTDFQGYMNDVRLYKGVAKYTSDFVVPSTNPDILPDTPSGVSGSSKLTKITDGAVSFDGTATTKLRVPDSTDFSFGTNDFCIEYFYYNNSLDGTYNIIFDNIDTNRSGIQLSMFTSNHYSIEVGDGAGNWIWKTTGDYPATQHKWVHFALTRDGNTFRAFENGVLLATQTSSTAVGNPRASAIGGYSADDTTVYGFDGYISNFRIVNGSSVYTSNFTPPTEPLTNITNTKLLCCQSNTSATTAAVAPGSITANGDAAATNFNPFNTDINTVRGQETGYATLNPLIKGSQVTLSDGNLSVSVASGTGRIFYSTPGASSGKWYAEYTAKSAGSTTMIGVSRPFNPTGNYLGVDSNYGYGYYGSNGQKYNGSGVSYGDSYTTGDTIGIALDLDERTLTFYKNGVSQGVAFSSLPDDDYYFAGGEGSMQGTMNFGQKPFKFPPPDGFQPLNAANIRPATVISRPDQYVGITTWKGDDQASHVINDLNFDGVPDFVWIKRRDGNAVSHQLYDTIRGATKPLVSSATSSEDTQTSGLIDFVRNGFELGASSIVNGLDGDNSNVPFNYVAWCWKAGGNKNTFNVDDVGYASASDINMSASSLNSATYNTSNRWSDDYAGASLSSGYPITQAFDGNRTTTARVEATQTAMSVALTNITVIDKIEVRGERGYITPYVEVTVGGTTYQIGGDPDTLITGSAGTTSRIITGVSGALTNVKVGRVTSGRTYLSQIIVDGKILVDDNITPPNAPSIAATGCSVGTKQGFSIIKYDGGGNAGDTIPHSLLQTPEFVVVKDKDDTDNWQIYHAEAQTSGGAKLLKFTDNEATSNDGPWHDTPPSSTTITLGGGGTNDSGNTHICYAWHSVPGLQKFGKYTGDNTAGSNGPFVELGFRPALVVIKRQNGTGNWIVYDNKRDTVNPLDGRLYWNTNSANVDNSGYDIDFLSNGFKITGGTNDNYNAASDYVYAAWAEAPAFNLYGGQSNAR